MNRIILLGRLTKEPEVRYTNTGKVVASFTMAVDRPFTGQDGKREADFIPVVIWGKPAETIGNYVQKGHRVLVEGRLQIRSYDGKDGQKRWVTEVIADRFEFIEKAGDKASNAPGGFESMGEAVPDLEGIPF